MGAGVVDRWGWVCKTGVERPLRSLLQQTGQEMRTNHGGEGTQKDEEQQPRVSPRCPAWVTSWERVHPTALPP